MSRRRGRRRGSRRCGGAPIGRRCASHGGTDQVELPGTVAGEEAPIDRLDDVHGVHLSAEPGVELGAHQGDQPASEAAEDLAGGALVAGAEPCRQLSERIVRLHGGALSAIRNHRSRPGIASPMGCGNGLIHDWRCHSRQGRFARTGLHERVAKIVKDPGNSPDSAYGVGSEMGQGGWADRKVFRVFWPRDVSAPDLPLSGPGDRIFRPHRRPGRSRPHAWSGRVSLKPRQPGMGTRLSVRFDRHCRTSRLGVAPCLSRKTLQSFHQTRRRPGREPRERRRTRRSLCLEPLETRSALLSVRLLDWGRGRHQLGRCLQLE